MACEGWNFVAAKGVSLLVQTQPLKTQVTQAKYVDIMPIMIRVEKLQNKACLPSLLCRLMCPGYFGSDFFFLLWDSVHYLKWKNKKIIGKVPKVLRTHQMTKKRRQASFILQILEFFYLTMIGIISPYLAWAACVKDSLTVLTLPMADLSGSFWKVFWSEIMSNVPKGAVPKESHTWGGQAAQNEVCYKVRKQTDDGIMILPTG